MAYQTYINLRKQKRASETAAMPREKGPKLWGPQRITSQILQGDSSFTFLRPMYNKTQLIQSKSSALARYIWSSGGATLHCSWSQC